MTETKECIYCKNIFSKGRDEANARWDKRLYCSRKCNDIDKRGMIRKPSTKRICQQCNKEFIKHYECTWIRWQNRKFCSKECADIGKIRKAPSTAFKKGNIPVNFKKVDYGYQAVHQWLRNHFTKSGICEDCGAVAKTQWANITGRYLRDRKDFKELCYSCHSKMDRKDPKNPKYYQS